MVSLLLLVSAPAMAAGPVPPSTGTLLGVLSTTDTLPSSWIGVWSTHIVQTDCTTNFTYYDQTMTDTLCADANITPDSTAAVPFGCTTQISGNSYHIVCDGSAPLEGTSCVATYHEDITGTVNGDSYSSNGTFTVAYSDSCFGIPDQCINIAITGTRTSSDPGVCANTPVESVSWGLLKSRYE